MFCYFMLFYFMLFYDVLWPYWKPDVKKHCLLGEKINAAICLELFVKTCKRVEKEQREDLNPGLGGQSNLGPPKW